ncbi:right-handed parallel beta-helix repeat-containing protein [Dysgonomonas sp. 216]|uniref:alpha-1,3-galactosidase-related protein n=1 Tax=Dysgonomonas sp. 216 TaxID=2302934 RepID=UPI0013D50049|nr:right-handed parallel beta-helix repeat-containing protein [Dysgonomonas sp. 216]NDW17621.1 right-handed parallel beta-helix repeat-containing protein [Dysgonomonas sp. 216]
MKKTLLILLFLFAGYSIQAKVINVSEFGVYPNTFQDVTESVKKAIKECKNNPGSTLVFPKGRYDFWDTNAERRKYFVSNTSSETDCPSKVKSIGLLFEGIKDVTVEGNGSQFIFHGKMITFAVDQSENITIQNVSVDFERPSMTEFTFDELSSNHALITVHPDSKYTVIDGRIRFYGEGWGMNDNFFSIQTDTLQGTNVYSSWDPIGNSQATEIAPFKLKLENNFSNENYQEGQTLTTRCHIRDHVGVFVNRSKNVKLENMYLHYMHGLGIVSQFSENLNYEKVHIVPSRGRTIAAFADGMHFSGCKGHVEIEDCNFKGLHDDPINVHGTYLRIEKIHSPNVVTMRFMHGQTYGMDAFFKNDTVAFIQSETLRKIGFSTVEETERISDRQIKVQLSKPLPKGIQEGDCLENLTWTPSLHISGCRMEMTCII